MVQIYVDDIVFGSMSKMEQFVEHMSIELEMILVSQVRQTSSNIFVSKVKYVKNVSSKFGLDTAKHKRSHIRTHEKITRDEAGDGVCLTLYSMGVCTRY